MEQLYGHAKEEAIGQTAHTLLADRIPLPLRRSGRSSGAWRVGRRVSDRARDGAERIVVSHWVLYRDEQGKPLQCSRPIPISPPRSASRSRSKAALKEKELLSRGGRENHGNVAGGSLCLRRPRWSNSPVQSASRQTVGTRARTRRARRTVLRRGPSFGERQNHFPMLNRPWRFQPQRVLMRASANSRSSGLTAPASPLWAHRSASQPARRDCREHQAVHDITERKQREEALRTDRDHLVAQVADRGDAAGRGAADRAAGKFPMGRRGRPHHLVRSICIGSTGARPTNLTVPLRSSWIHPSGRSVRDAVGHRAGLRANGSHFRMRERILRPDGDGSPPRLVETVGLDSKAA